MIEADGGGSFPAYTVRIARPSDAGAVTAVLRTAYPAGMASAYPDAVLKLALPGMTRANPRLLRSGTYFVAETPEGGLIGCGGWTPERPGDRGVRPGVAHVRHFGTHPDWGSLGVGRALFAACERQARNAGVQMFECYASLNAVPFYQALGFRPVAERRIALTVRRHIDSMHMIRKI